MSQQDKRSRRRRPSDERNDVRRKKRHSNRKNTSDRHRRRRKVKKRENKLSRTIGLVLAIVQLIATGIFMAGIFKLNMLPTKYVVAATVALVLFWGVILASQFFSKKNAITGKVISVLITVLLIFSSYYLFKVSGTVSKISGGEYKLDKVVVSVMADDSAEAIKDAKNYTFGVQYKMNGDQIKQTVQAINEELGTEIKTEEYDTLAEQAEALHDGKVDAIIYNQGFTGVLEEAFEGYEDNTKVIYSHDIKTEIEDTSSDVEVKNDTFSVYISGIDVYGAIETNSRILPPALIAVTVSMTIFPLSTGLMVSLDPFCPLENIDIEFMDRKPNFWALIPLYCEMLMSSDRIPEDYDMSHLRTIGAGAEAMNDRKYAEVEEFFHKHNVQAKLSAGYGQSEGCSNFTLPNPMFPLEDGCVGMPMTATVLGVFDKDLNELNYGESGELCMTGPSMMLHYSGWRGEELTEQTLIEHSDGNTWLHTGDEAYITEQGIVHILGRGEIKAYGDKPLHVMRMETKTVRTPGVKDGFFCLVPDQEHEGYYRPYLFVILDGTKTLEEVAELLKDTLEEHEYPVEIREITERPYFHFKTDRKGLTAQILKELEQAKEEK